MSESDSWIPQKVAALAGALKAVLELIGTFKPLDLAFLHWHRDEGPESVPWDNDREDERKKLLAAVAEFVEAVDTAERLLNAIPFKDLEPLSSFTGGVRWDVQTRRILIEIQIITSVLCKYSTDPDFLLSYNGIGSKARFDEMLYKLIELKPELSDRISNLKYPPDDQSDPTNAIPAQRRATKEPVANPNENTQSKAGSVLQSTAMLVEIKGNSEGSLLGTPKQTTKEREAAFDDAISDYADSDWRRDKRLNNKAWRVRSKEQTGELFGEDANERGWYQSKTGEQVIRKDKEGAWVYLTASHSKELKEFFSAFVA